MPLPQTVRVLYPQVLIFILLFLSGVSAVSAQTSDFSFIDTSAMSSQGSFALSAWHNGEDVLIGFEIPPDHYLYRQHFGVSPQDMGPLRISDGKTHEDEFFGDVEVYRDKVVMASSLSLDSRGSKGPITITVDYQGCSDRGICFPPASETVKVEHRSISPSQFFLEVSEIPDYAIQKERFEPEPQQPERPSATTVSNVAPLNEEEPGYLEALKGASLPAVMGLFFLAGLALTFTPCVLPMMPILSAMIVGQSASRKRAFSLSASYVTGMAATYTLVGVLMGLFGASLNIQARLQSPVVLAVFAVIFIALALALVGAFNLQLPQSIAGKVSGWQDRVQHTGHIGSAIAGALSVLVVSPCVSAPLAGAMVFISTTGEASTGGLALLAMALGMGIPLLLVGTFGATFLPKSGPWMNQVKAVFGLMMFGIAVWLVDRILVDAFSLLAWAGFLIAVAMTLGCFDGPKQSFAGKLGKGLSVLPLVWATALILSAASGGSNPLQPLGHLNAPSVAIAATPEKAFKVTTINELDALIAAAEKPVFAHISADWCASCQVMKSRFAQPEVATLLKGFTVVEIDVTSTSADSREILDTFEAFGPPALLIYKNGSTEPNKTLHGEVEVRRLINELKRY